MKEWSDAWALFYMLQDHAYTVSHAQLVRMGFPAVHNNNPTYPNLDVKKINPITAIALWLQAWQQRFDPLTYLERSMY